MESTCAFLLFIVTGSLSMAYFVTLKTYHTSLNKMDSLKELLSNPNARVATREQGARIMEVVNKHQESTAVSQSTHDANILVKKLT